MPRGHNRATVNATGSGFDSQSRKLNIKYFHFIPGIEVNHGVKCRHSTFMAPEFDAKRGTVSYQ